MFIFLLSSLHLNRNWYAGVMRGETSCFFVVQHDTYLPALYVYGLFGTKRECLDDVQCGEPMKLHPLRKGILLRLQSPPTNLSRKQHTLETHFSVQK